MANVAYVGEATYPAPAPAPRAAYDAPAAPAYQENSYENGDVVILTFNFSKIKICPDYSR